MASNALTPLQVSQNLLDVTTWAKEDNDSSSSTTSDSKATPSVANLPQLFKSFGSSIVELIKMLNGLQNKHLLWLNKHVGSLLDLHRQLVNDAKDICVHLLTSVSALVTALECWRLKVSELSAIDANETMEQWIPRVLPKMAEERRARIVAALQGRGVTCVNSIQAMNATERAALEARLTEALPVGLISGLLVAIGAVRTRDEIKQDILKAIGVAVEHGREIRPRIRGLTERYQSLEASMLKLVKDVTKASKVAIVLAVLGAAPAAVLTAGAIATVVTVAPLCCGADIAVAAPLAIAGGSAMCAFLTAATAACAAAVESGKAVEPLKKLTAQVEKYQNQITVEKTLWGVLESNFLAAFLHWETAPTLAVMQDAESKEFEANMERVSGNLQSLCLAIEDYRKAADSVQWKFVADPPKS